MSKRRRIAIVTGTRAEYGLLTSTLAALADRRGVEVQLVVTGMHVLRQFGYTVRRIVADGWPIAARVPMQRGDDDPADQARGLSRGITGIARFLVRARSDMVVVLGDRIEALAGALAGVTTGCAVAHIHGGDVAPGDFDDSLRHAITKLAHVHLAATPSAAKRIVRLGEDSQRVHVVGAPGLDRLRELLAEPHAAERIGTSRRRARMTPPLPREGPGEGSQRTALVVYHACGRAPVVERRTMDAILAAVRAAGLRRLISYPNSDRGYAGVVAAIEAHARRYPQEVTAFRSVARDTYLRMLMDAAAIVGNSSSGIIEAPLAGTPTVNVGSRQAGREPGGRHIFHASETRSAIAAALQRALALPHCPPRTTVYGDGQAGWRIARILAETPLNPALIRKVITY